MKLSDYIKKYGDNDVDETALFELTADNEINVLQEIAALKKNFCTLNSELDFLHKNVGNQIEAILMQMKEIDKQTLNKFKHIEENELADYKDKISEMSKNYENNYCETRKNYLFVTGVFVIFQVLNTIINIVF